MKLSDLMRGVSRAPWNSVARHLFNRAGYDTTRGYKKTVDAVLAGKNDPEKVAAFAKGLVENIVCGEKLIQFIKVTSAERNVLETWVRGKRMFANVLTDAFPGTASENDIIPLLALEPTSAGYVELEDGVAALFTSVRSYVKSEDIPTSNLKNIAAAGFERLVGYRRVHFQCYDAIWLPKTKPNFVVLAIDYPDGVPKAGFANPASAFLRFVLRQQLARTPKVANFWDAVDGLYEGKDGKLVDYGFTAGGHSVNHHKARRRTSVCLRKAVYDAAGAAAVKAAGKNLELFKVAMQWGYRHADGVVTEPEVLVPGLAADLNKAMPAVDHCIVRNCLSSRDLALVISKLDPLIKNWI
ncbi:hypothetical protein [uncultured Xanthomonas sp.]|uniref:hypothetical protein n=1 Tax=uncultured Xanthomonas sp. TaxID=152831 RepID=UPI0025FE3CB6|nr:hypothetical protein [uncultured Xanthomonas sp.]